MLIHASEPARIELANLPTPIGELQNLARDLGTPTILIKRDDLTGVELTGNKSRKLEYVLADALAQGCDALVTHGGYQSNHCRATASAAAKLQLPLRLLLRAPAITTSNTREGNLFLDHLFGAQVTIRCTEEYNARRSELIEEAMNAFRNEGRSPYFFPVGASVPVGCWGYIRCAAELVEQLGDRPLDIFVPLGSAGTFAGLILGKAILNAKSWRIIGVPVSDSVGFFARDVRRLIDETIAQYRLELSIEETTIELLDGYIGDGYAIPTPAALETIHHVARREGIALDPTYTGKAFVAVVDAIKRKAIRKDATPLFLHTGGVFGLLARHDLFNFSEQT